ncbi:uncharacterized protein B0H18DRAFT_1211784 [Fomitopsis serialis]|uniref:uncharacterized protein n=1 Tax=Fomitopsis serialis TaxID=139415 RepID=UPI00200827C4|nr:uncharacterized protein B0H18DRAFT_1211784 [Neoantrodia serialis]KAH9924524.1 hypothetical protein B0H18DRAFT_1211784 [Neoantrodia serialis]
MSVSRALSVPEILLHVFEQLKPDVKNLDQEREGICAVSLARSASVCKHFREPASRVLWREIPTFAVLVKLLSSSVKTVPVYVLHRNIQADEWERFKYYARFVRCCRAQTWEFDPEVRAPVDPTVYHHLSIQSAGQPILPNLEVLEWSQDSALITSLLFLLHPSVRWLSIFMRDNPYERRYESDDRTRHALQMLLNGIYIASPRLGHLALRGMPCFENVFPKIPSSPSSSPVDRSLDISRFWQLNTKLINKLVRVRFLTTLTVRILYGLPETRERPVLKALKTLVVNESEAAACASFLAAVALPRLGTLHLHLEDARTAATLWPKVAETLPHLHTLVVSSRKTGSTSNRPSARPTRSVIAVIQPLLALGNLRKVEIELGAWALDTSDDDIRQITQSWPKLRELKLRHRPSSVRPSLHALSFAAQHCADLESLTLPPVYHDGDVPTSDSAPLHPHGLQELHVDGWTVKAEAKDFTSHIAALFPHAKMTGVMN